MAKLEKLERSVRDMYEAKAPNRADWSDWLYAEHVFVVADYAEELAERYDAPVYMCRAAAVLHDIADATMSRFAPEHEQASLVIARKLLNDTGFTSEEVEVIVDDAIKLHSCYDGQKPKTKVGRILATADALAHLKTNFYVHATQHMMSNMSEDKRREWAAKKIPRDFNDKIAFDDIRDATRPDYEKLVSYFNIT